MDLILAMDKNCAIGKKGELLYNIPEDMKHFREMTMGKVVVMGQNTFLSLPNQKPLKNRTNIVLSADKNFVAEGCVNVHSFDEMFAEIAKYPEDSVMLIGGGSLYNALYTKCKRAYITFIGAETEGADTFVPNFFKLSGWVIEGKIDTIDTGKYLISFLTFKNNNLGD